MTNILNRVKKGLFYLTIPALTGCASTFNLPDDDVYYTVSKKEIIIPEQENNLEEKSKTAIFDSEFYWRMKSLNPSYSRSLGWDFDGDGIVNALDPWPYNWGPYLDANDNGIIDAFDIQVNGFFSPLTYHDNFYWPSYYHHHSHWHHYNWDNHTNNETYYGPRKASSGTNIPRARPNKRGDRSSEEYQRSERPTSVVKHRSNNHSRQIRPTETQRHRSPVRSPARQSPPATRYQSTKSPTQKRSTHTQGNIPRESSTSRSSPRK